MCSHRPILTKTHLQSYLVDSVPCRWWAVMAILPVLPSLLASKPSPHLPVLPKTQAIRGWDGGSPRWNPKEHPNEAGACTLLCSCYVKILSSHIPEKRGLDVFTYGARTLWSRLGIPPASNYLLQRQWSVGVSSQVSRYTCYIPISPIFFTSASDSMLSLSVLLVY